MIQALPNLLTLLRLLAAPVLVWLVLSQDLEPAFWVFVGAGVSDALDGFIAKQFDAETMIGAFLDPLADKALLIGSYIALGYMGHLPGWLVILVVFRDVLILGGAILYGVIANELDPRPLWVSKANTTAQILLAAWVLGNLGLGLGMEVVSTLLIYLVAGTTLASGGAYVWIWGRKAMTMEPRS